MARRARRVRQHEAQVSDKSSDHLRTQRITLPELTYDFASDRAPTLLVSCDILAFLHYPLLIRVTGLKADRVRTGRAERVGRVGGSPERPEHLSSHRNRSLPTNTVGRSKHAS